MSLVSSRIRPRADTGEVAQSDVTEGRPAVMANARSPRLSQLLVRPEPRGELADLLHVL